MCGVAGFRGAPDPGLLRDMTATLRHRGPDDEGYSEDGAVSLGFRRLSIIDIAGGRQPMHSADGCLSLIYNGEVYNYRELRSELQALGHGFETDSDSEVILRAYEAWGVDAFPRLNGMWAFALADRRDGSLVLCRDHFGIKPLYYAEAGGRLLFASEIKALLRAPELRPTVDDQVLYEYLAFGLHDHRPETFFAGIRRLPAAHYAIVDDAGMRLERYWQPRLSRGGDSDAARFAAAFRTSVARRLVADVPVGLLHDGELGVGAGAHERFVLGPDEAAQVADEGARVGVDVVRVRARCRHRDPNVLALVDGVAVEDRREGFDASA